MRLFPRASNSALNSALYLGGATIVAVALGSGLPTSGRAFSMTLDMPPTVPQPSQSGDLVGFNVQNTGSATLAARVITFGQVFARGAVMPGASLAARDSDVRRRAQLDTLATYPDGSVRLAAITTRIPQLAAGASISGMLAAAAPSTLKSVSLAKSAPQLTVSLTLAGKTQIVDLGAALQASIASGTADYWLQGPCATQARVDVPVSGSFHLTADITGYFDGSVKADVQFNNDLAMESSGGATTVSATVTLNGSNNTFSNISQQQYQDWHTIISTNGTTTLNVQHDISYLEHAGAILPYDLTTGVSDTTLQTYVATESAPGFGTPLAVNGVTQYMPTTGGRPDIGYTTQYNTVWLLTQDSRAADIALAQGDTGGAVPWNLKLANGHWLTPGDYVNIWTDPRGGPNTYTIGLTQPINLNFGWTPDSSHQPNLAYVPYISTATRWYLDRLNAQAAYDLSVDWPGVRCIQNASACDTILNGQDQVRSQGWSLREIEEAALFGRSGSWEQSYFTTVAADNWAFVQSQEQSWGTAQGQATGWLPGAYGTGTGAQPPFEDDYVTGAVGLAALFGDTGAAQFINWQSNGWLAGRFTAAAGWNLHDGCPYNLNVSNTTDVPYTQWSAIETATVAAHNSNGTGWQQSQGDYCALARAALGTALTLNPTNSKLAAALSWLNTSGAPQIDPTSFETDPTFNVVPLK